MKENENSLALFIGIVGIVVGFYLGMTNLQHSIEAIEHKMQMHGWGKP